MRHGGGKGGKGRERRKHSTTDPGSHTPFSSFSFSLTHTPCERLPGDVGLFPRRLRREVGTHRGDVARHYSCPCPRQAAHAREEGQGWESSQVSDPLTADSACVPASLPAISIYSSEETRQAQPRLTSDTRRTDTQHHACPHTFRLNVSYTQSSCRASHHCIARHTRASMCVAFVGVRVCARACERVCMCVSVFG